MKKTLFTASLLLALGGCNGSEEYIYEPIIEQEITLTTAFAGSQSFESRKTQSAAPINYQHQLIVDGYKIVIDELDDGGENYTKESLTLTESSYSVPIVGKANISVIHPSALLDTTVLNGNVSQVYTYQASQSVSNGQQQVDIIFENDGWVYTTLLPKPSFGKTIISASLVDEITDEKVEMIKANDNGTTYYYGYIRSGAKMRVETSEDGVTETSIPVSVQPPTNNIVEHVEFLVDGDTVISDPVKGELPPIAPPPQPPESPEDILFLENNTYNSKEHCRQGAMKHGVEHYIPVAGSCLLEDINGDISGNEMVELGFEIQTTPTPITFKQHTSQVDNKEQCNNYAHDEGAVFYAIGELKIPSLNAAKLDCMISTTVENEIDYYEYDLVLEHAFDVIETNGPTKVEFYSETYQTSRDFCIEYASNLYDYGTLAKKFAFNKTTNQCYHRDPNGDITSQTIIDAELETKFTPTSVRWFKKDNGKDAGTDKSLCQKRTAEANLGNIYYVSTDESNCYRELNEPVEESEKERIDYTLSEDNYTYGYSYFFYTMFDENKAYRDIPGDEICSSLGEDKTYSWNTTSKMPQCDSTDINKELWLNHCSDTGGTAYFETDFEKGTFSCIKQLATPSSLDTTHWDVNGLEMCQRSDIRNEPNTILYQHIDGKNVRCLAANTIDLSDKSDAFDADQLNRDKCWDKAGLGIPSYSSWPEHIGDYHCEEMGDPGWPMQIKPVTVNP